MLHFQMPRQYSSIRPATPHNHWFYTESGLLFSPQNADSLTEAIERFLALSRTEREAMGQEGRRHVQEHFDRKKVVDAYMEEIRRILGA